MSQAYKLSIRPIAPNLIFDSWQIMIETRYEETTQTTTFSILTETFIHIIYILQLQRPVHRLNMEISMSQRTNETIQTIMDTMLTTTFWILAKTFMHTICRQQREQPAYRFKAKTLISPCTNETAQTTMLSIDSKNVLTLKTTGDGFM